MTDNIFFAVADASTGRILASGECPPDMLSAQAGAGQAVAQVDGSIDPNAWRVVGGELVALVPTPADFERLKSEKLARIDAGAESVRGLFVTLGSGQAMVYQAKALEADVVLASSDPDALDAIAIPHIASFAAVSGRTRLDVAQEIATLAAQWRMISGQIEALRLGAKEAVKAATTPEQIASAMPDWSPILALAP